MKIRTFRIGAALVALIASAGLAAAVAAKPGRGGLDRLERKLERIEISTESKTAAFAILDQARPAHRALRAEVHDAREALRTLLETEPVDEAAVMAQADVVSALQAEAHKQKLRTLLQVRTALTPEEREAFAKRGPKHGRHHGRH